ncbi:putative chaperonin Cpn60/TCP-1 family, TCP-1-like chaperonin intermediate domain superfamily [Helianthus anomalus]
MDKMLQSPDADITIKNDGATILEQMDVDNQIGKVMVELSPSQDYEIASRTWNSSHSSCTRVSKIAVDHLEKIAHKFDISATNIEPLVQTCMTTLSSKIVNRCKRSLAEIAVMAVADLERKDVNLA